MRVVLDTNVVVSAVLFGGIPEECLRRALAREVELVTSRPLLDELERTLTRRFGVSAEAASYVCSDLELASEIVVPRPIAPVSRDASDDVVLATAVEGRAEHIVTGDRDLLTLGEYADVRIIAPRALLDLLMDARA